MSTSSETKVTRPPLSPNQIKGIDLVVKGISKKYPYIIGWEKSSVFEKYQSQMFINLIVDMNKLSEYHNSPIKSYWVDDLIEGRYDSIGGAFYLINYDEIEDIARDNRKNLEKRINDIYKSLPKEFQVFITWEGGAFTNSKGEHYATLSNIDIHTYYVKIFN
jgi:hypothetical protein